MNGIELMCLYVCILSILMPISCIASLSYFFIYILKKNNVIKTLKITTLLMPIILPIMVLVGIVCLIFVISIFK